MWKWRAAKDWKNNSDQRHSCPRDWRLTASWGGNWGLPWNPPCTPQHYRFVGLKGLIGSPWCRETIDRKFPQHIEARPILTIQAGNSEWDRKSIIKNGCQYLNNKLQIMPRFDRSLSIQFIYLFYFESACKGVRTTVRETGASRHHGGPIKDPFSYIKNNFKGVNNWTPII